MSRTALEALCGQLIVGGFVGTSLPEDVARALFAGRRAGVILFSRNVESVEQVHALTSAVVATTSGAPPLVAIDQEGGRVQRLGEPVIQLPPMRRLGEHGDPAVTEKLARALGLSLRSLGFSMDFAPVLDVDKNPDNPVIGDRSFGADPARVIAHARAFADGLRAGGVAPCGKHFPGHGDTDLDSHLDLPVVRRDRMRLERIELAPFRALARELPALMSAHVVYPALDEAPATLSRHIARRLLRQELRFEGVLFSDDLQMRALADRMSIEQSAVRAVEAGCDVLLICKHVDWQERALEALVHAAEADSAFRARVTEAAARSQQLRQHFVPEPAADRHALSAALGSELIVEARALSSSLSKSPQLEK